MPLWSPLPSDDFTSPDGSLDVLYNGPYSHSRSELKASQACKLQNMLYKQCVEKSDFCDVTLVFHDTEIKAHWCVLVGCPYFKALHNFNKTLKKTTKDTVTVDFGNSEAMKAAIMYLYTGEVSLSLDNIEDFLSAADYLQIGDLTSQCSQFLNNLVLSTQNCTRIMLMSSLYNLSTYEEAIKYVCGHLPELLQGEHLLDVTESSLLAFFTDPTLSYVKREEFFEFLVRWTEKDPERQEHFCQLFLALDLLMIPVPVLIDVIKNHHFVKNCSTCQLHCEQTLKTCRDLDSNGSMMTSVIIMGGGSVDTMYRYHQTYYDSHTASNSLISYFVEKNQWKRLPNLPYPIRKPLMALTEEGKLLVMDSVQHGTCKRPKEILRYCPRQNQWDTLQMKWPPNEYDFEFHYFATCNGRVFFVASSKTEKPSRRCQPLRAQKQPGVEVMSPRHHVQLLEMNKGTGQLMIKFIFFQRSLNSNIRVSCNSMNMSPTLNGEVIFVMGTKCFGFRSTSLKNPSSKTFYYDVSVNRGWELSNKYTLGTEPMTIGLSGGFFNARLGKVIQKWLQVKDRKVVPTKDHTVPLPPVQPARERYPYMVVNDELYIFGGKTFETMETIMSVVKYSFRSKAWTELKPLPEFMLEAGITRGRLPVDVLRCHADCPHCVYEPVTKTIGYADNLADLDDDSDGDLDSPDYYDSYSGSDVWPYPPPEYYDEDDDFGDDWF